jgi:multimeric flavodoxin WrbA
MPPVMIPLMPKGVEHGVEEMLGTCVIDDDMAAILSAREEADAIVLGAPVNFGDVNALTRTFLEHMLGFAFWQWAYQGAPRLRSKTVTKKAVLVTLSAAPGFLPGSVLDPLKRSREWPGCWGLSPSVPW